MPYPHTELTGSVSVESLNGIEAGPVSND